MTLIFVSIVLLSWGTFINVEAQNFDPTGIDYCGLKCKEKYSAGCNCSVVKPREEPIIKDIVNFRQRMLDIHNHYRNHFASGLENSTSVTKSAANMMLLNYDMELEYLARCFGIHSVTDQIDKCRQTKDVKMFGQNIGGIKEKDLTKLEDIVGEWYGEVKDSGSSEKFVSGSPYKHFAQVVWSTVDLLGCGRIWNPDGPGNYKLVLICNYKTTSQGVPNPVNNHQIYHNGDPCSQCPTGHKCETARYTSLCGKELPVPTDPVLSLTFDTDMTGPTEEGGTAKGSSTATDTPSAQMTTKKSGSDTTASSQLFCAVSLFVIIWLY